ncbi:MAG TPA: sulfotransferase [Gemmatimonadota bacterium]|nr:sulfotransferase [Gemmatimonadota bacterium]
MASSVSAAGPRYPDFYLVGAAKSGTTSLFHYLAQHPSIFIPWKKEPHYFADPSVFSGGSHSTLESYLRLYEDCPREILAGDGSTSYLPSRSAAARIKEVRPEARILVILRNPVDRAYSHYWHQRVEFAERLSFEDAIKDEARRIEQGLPYGFLYLRTGMYFEQLRRFIDVFGANVRVHLYDDLRSDPGALCRDVFAFLEVDPGQHVDTGRMHHRSGPVRSRTLGRLLARPLPGRRKLVRRWPRWARTLRVRMSQRNVTAPPPMSADTRSMLTEVFRPDVERLQGLLGRDLSSWLDAGSDRGPGQDSEPP